MRPTIMAANWKMNGSQAMAESYFAELAQRLSLQAHNPNVELVFALPLPLLCRAASWTKGTPWLLAAQNAHWQEEGAYTGEVSLGMLKEMAVETVIIAHSERRQYFNETDATAALKVQACLAAAMTPIVCIGESLPEREGGQTAAVLRRQLAAILGPLSSCAGLRIAYEPVWAIGTGLAATTTQVAEAHSLIRGEVRGKFGSPAAADLPILYGGSMTPANCRELLALADVDGGLIGGASLKAASFAEMVAEAVKAR